MKPRRIKTSPTPIPRSMKTGSMYTWCAWNNKLTKNNKSSLIEATIATNLIFPSIPVNWWYFRIWIEDISPLLFIYDCKVSYIFIFIYFNHHYYSLFTWRLTFFPNSLPEISVIRIGIHYIQSWLLVLIYPLNSIYALSQLKVNSFSQGHF